LGIFLSSAVVLFVSKGPLFGAVIIGISNILSGTAFLLFIKQNYPAHYRLWLVPSIVFILIVPLVWLPALALVLFLKKKSGSTEIVREYSEHVFYHPPGRAEGPGPLERRAEVKQLEDIILNSADIGKKTGAINELVGLNNPEAIKVIREALRNLGKEYKIYAASALHKIEKKLENEIMQWRGLAERETTHAGASLGLGTAYMNYCYLGVLDESSTRRYSKLALKHFLRVLKVQPGNSALYLNLCKVCIHAREYRDALCYAEQFITLHPNDPNGYIWKAEAEYYLGDYEQVKEVCTKLMSLEHPAYLNDVAGVWATPQELSHA
jgi:tetratricopeptide (TPR) repeat protein